MRKKAVEVKGLYKFFKGKPVLKNINLKVDCGEIFGLIGPNGAGKTTLIQTLLGIVLPEKGKVFLLGKDFYKEETAVKEEINFAAAYSRIYSEITVRENLMTFARLYNIPHKAEKINSLLRYFKIEKLKNVLIRGLSSGEMMRVMLAKVFLNDPKLIFFDEPTASLDFKMKQDLWQLIAEIRKTKELTIVWASHDLSEIASFSDRVAFMDKGTIVWVKTAKKVNNWQQVFKN